MPQELTHMDTRRDVNLKLRPDLFVRFTQWCERNGFKKQGKLERMVEELVKDEPLPQVEVVTETKIETQPVRLSQIIPPEWSQFDPQRKFFDTLAANRWIPDAIVEVRQACEDFGGIKWTPKLPSENWLAGYRVRALAAGRDPEADIASAGVGK